MLLQDGDATFALLLPHPLVPISLTRYSGSTAGHMIPVVRGTTMLVISLPQDADEVSKHISRRGGPSPSLFYPHYLGVLVSATPSRQKEVSAGYQKIVNDSVLWR